MSEDPKVTLETLQPAKALVAFRGNAGPPLPSRYTAALHTAIVMNVQSGMPPKTAAITAGLTGREWNDWKRQVEAGVAHPQLTKLFDDIENAHHLDMMGKLNQILSDPSKEDLKWALEKLYKDFEKKEVKLQVENQLRALAEKLMLAVNVGRISYETANIVLEIMSTED